MIIIKLLGGLGNQMFQYAMGRKLSILHQTDFKFEVDGLQAGEDIRSTYELGIFNIPCEKFASRDETFPFIRKTRFRSKKLNDVINRIYKRKLIVERGHFAFNPDFIAQSTRNCYIRGLWQSEKYFKDVEDILRDELSFKEPMKGKNLELSNYLKNNNKTVSLHVRRGEFAKDPKYSKLIGTCDMDYYKRAKEYIETKIKDPQYIVFSDDIPWAKENLPVDEKTKFIDYNKDNNHYRDMQLMGLCKHNIIANSTFSWWGAWLNQNPEKIVIVPKQWFAGWVYDTKDLIPENWIKI